MRFSFTKNSPAATVPPRPIPSTHHCSSPRMRHLDPAGSYLSSNDKRLHFGLGDAENCDIEIRWPSGIRQTLHAVKADQFFTIEEPEQ